jgi:hypothetical protein
MVLYFPKLVASPRDYAIDGRGFIVILNGSGKLKINFGEQYVAFCLTDGDKF